MNRSLTWVVLLTALFACSPPIDTTTYPESVITSEIIVSLEAASKIEDVIGDIKKPTFNLKETLSPRMLIFLLEYDDNKHSPAKAREVLKEHSSVKSAEFNKKVEVRDQK